MNKNIKIAKELIKLAKNLIQEEKTAKWDWKHPFTFDKKKQDNNELQDKIKSGQITDVILVRFDDKYGGDSNWIIEGYIVSPKNINVSPSDLGFEKNVVQIKGRDDFGTNGLIKVGEYSDGLIKKIEEYKGCKVVWGTDDSKIEKYLDITFDNVNKREQERIKKEQEKIEKEKAMKSTENQRKIVDDFIEQNKSKLKLNEYEYNWINHELFIITQDRKGSNDKHNYTFECVINVAKMTIFKVIEIWFSESLPIKETEVKKNFSNLEDCIEFFKEIIEKNNNEKWQDTIWEIYKNKK